ncbi:hypothetical protein ABH932_004866 [Streptacidiphilus sp. MAP5-52]
MPRRGPERISRLFCPFSAPGHDSGGMLFDWVDTRIDETNLMNAMNLMNAINAINAINARNRTPQEEVPGEPDRRSSRGSQSHP